MSIDQETLKKLKEFSKDVEALKKLENLMESLLDDLDEAKEQLGLLEGAIRNDYDSILITELNLDNPGPRIVYVNDGFTKMTGYLPKEAIGKTPRILQGPKTDRAILDRLKRRLIEGQAFFGHSINYRKDGSEFINQWDIHPLMNKEGEVTHWVSYQRDVTEKKETAKAIFNTDFDELLKRTEEFTFKFSKEPSNESIVCNFLSDAYEELTGFNSDIVFESGLESSLHDEDKISVMSALSNAFSGESSTEYCRYRTVADDFIYVIQSFKPVWDDTQKKVLSVKSVAKLELKES